MDTITFSGQLLVATQNDTCRAISVTINNTGESCCNGCDVTIAGIICGAVVLICLMAMIILLRKLNNDNEWKMIQAVIEKKKHEQEHAWDVKKEMVDREKLLQDRKFNRCTQSSGRLRHIFEHPVSVESHPIFFRLGKCGYGQIRVAALRAGTPG